MIRNYLLTSIRYLLRHKTFSFINIIGLSLAMAISFIIMIYVLNELSYNKCHKNSDKIYRVLCNRNDFNSISPGTPYAMADALKSDFPQIQKLTRTRRLRNVEFPLNDSYISERGFLCADPDVFDIFTIRMLSGNPENGLIDNLYDIVVSEKIADKYFAGENPVGKSINAKIQGVEHTFIIKGLMENIPENSTFNGDIIGNIELSLKQIQPSFEYMDIEKSWTSNFWWTFILFSENTDSEYITENLKNFEKQHLEEDMDINYELQHFPDVYLHSTHLVNNYPNGNINNIYLFSGIAILIMLIACINYIILSSAISTARSKEIGIRKVVGATRNNIKKQIIGESIIVSFFALPIALIFLQIALPYANILFNTNIELFHSNSWKYIIGYFLITLFVGIVSGLYTSVFLSKFETIEVIKNKALSGKNRKPFRMILIAIQLFIFFILATGVIMIHLQYKFANSMDLGYNKDNKILIYFNSDKFTDYKTLVNNIKNYPDIINAAYAMEGCPTNNSMSMMIPTADNPDKEIKLEGMAVGFDYIETIELEILKGRSFSKEFISDIDNAIILNETAVQEIGLKDPLNQKVIGKRVIGIVKDFHFHSIHTKIPPLNIELIDEYIGEVLVHYEEGSFEKTLYNLEKEWNNLAPDQPFYYATFDTALSDLYTEEKNMQTIMLLASILAIVIAASGLFGLTMFLIYGRTKEIAIKKVFGASTSSIVVSFIKDFVVLLFISFAFSIPLSIYFVDKWLQNYAYSTELKWWVFLVVFLIASFIVLSAILIQLLKAANLKATNALKYE